MGDFLAEAGVGFREILAQGRLADAIDQLAEEGVEVLVVRAGMQLVGTVSAREIITAQARAGTAASHAPAIQAIMTPDPATIDVAAEYTQGLKRLGETNPFFIILTNGERIAGVVSGQKLALALCRLLQDELNALNHYLADLHEAGMD